METNWVLGFGFIMLGAVCNGTFALPSKYVDNYEWENTWGSFFLFTMVVIPSVVALFLLKDPYATWDQVWMEKGAAFVIAPVAFGFLWGCGVIGFGIGVTMIGLSLGYSIIMGLCALLGALLPLLTQHFDQAFTSAGLTIISGICVCVIGVGVCGRAGVLREWSQTGDTEKIKLGERKMVKGLTICILAGVFSACCNLAFSYGIHIKIFSEKHFGNAPWIATLAVWLLIFWGGFLASGSYAVYLLFKNATWANFVESKIGWNFILTAMMATLHFATLFFYGVGAHYLGRLGTSVGWAVNMSSALIVANCMGFITAEWSGVSAKSRYWIFAGLAVLIIGIIILGVGNNMQH